MPCRCLKARGGFGKCRKGMKRVCYKARRRRSRRRR